MALVLAATQMLAVHPAAAQPCTGDCGADGRVTVNELIVGVNILLGGAPVDDCAAADADGDGAVAVAELVAAVNSVLRGCGGEATPTVSTTPSVSPTPTVTATPARGPVITFLGLTSADDSPQTPTPGPGGIPIYERPFGFGFSVVVEARRGSAPCSDQGQAACPPGENPFAGGGTPDLQVQVNRPLGNGSGAVCDNGSGEPPVFGGVPAVDPPWLGNPAEIADALNDFGCRFVDGSGLPAVRRCALTACIRFEDGEFGCIGEGTELQFCAPIPMPMEFPLGDTLVSARLRDMAGTFGPVAQMLVRVTPP